MLTGLATQRQADIFARRNGWYGDGRRTLDAVAQAFGITRERVRQICSLIEGRVKGRQGHLPALEECVRVVSQLVPTTVSEVEARLIDLNLSVHPFDPMGILDAARRLGIAAPFEVESFRGRAFVVPKGASGIAAKTWRAARACINHWGVGSTLEIAGRVSSEGRFSLPVVFASTVLQAFDHVDWLDDSRGWFWFGPLDRNPLINIVRKVISVAGRVRVSELRRAISRTLLMRGFAPPTRVLREVCQRLDGCRLEGDFVMDVGLARWVGVLPTNEALFVLALKQLGPLVARDRLLSRCRELGIAKHTTIAYMSNSPVVARYAHCVYGLVGAEFPPGAAEALVPTKARYRALIDFGQGQGRIWLGFRLTHGMLGNGVFTVPAPMQRFLSGKFALLAEDKVRVGEVVLRDNQGWGLLPFYRRRGLEPGDHLVLVFDRTALEVVARIGDESLLDEYQPND